MPNTQCNPNTAAAAIAAMAAENGAGPSLTAINAMPTEGLVSFNQAADKITGQKFDAVSPTPIEAHATKTIAADESLSPRERLSGLKVLKFGLHETRDASRVIGPDIAEPLRQVVVDHYREWGPRMREDSTAGRSEFTAKVKAALEGGQRSDASNWVAAEAYERYAKWLQGGADLYPQSSSGAHTSLPDKLADTVSNNIIVGSPNVFFGTIFEVPIKGFAVRGPRFAADMFKAAFVDSGGNPLNLFKKNPEAEAHGLYGRERTALEQPLIGNDFGEPFGAAWRKAVFEPGRNFREKMNQFTDPFSNVGTNIAWAAANGDPARAAQLAREIVFRPKMGDPTIAQMSGRTGAYKLLSYTAKTAQAYGGALSKMLGGGDIATKADGLKWLLAWHVLQAGVNAGTSAIEGKDPVEGAKIGLAQIPILLDVAQAFDPGLKDWVSENQSVLGKAAGASGIQHFFLSADIFNTTKDRVMTGFQKAYEAAQSGDNPEAVAQAAFTMIRMAPFFNVPFVSTSVGQRTFTLAQKLIQGEADSWEALGDTVIDTYRLPRISPGGNE